MEEGKDYIQELEEKLTDKQISFVREYISNGYNSKRAYLKVNPDVQDNSAYELGSRMLRNVDTLAYKDALVNEELNKIIERKEKSVSTLMEMIEKNEDGHLTVKAINSLSKLDGTAVERIDHTTKGEKLERPTVLVVENGGTGKA